MPAVSQVDLNKRPVIVAIAGPNGAGKTTFYYAHLQAAGLRFINADILARELQIESYPAARLADTIRKELVRQRESFVFETVFSDPAGEKLGFLKAAANAGYDVILCYIGTDSPEISEQRVAMRVSQGGHDVPSQKLKERFPRILANLESACRELPHVRVFNNTDLRKPYRLLAVVKSGKVARSNAPRPKWLTAVMPVP